MLAAEAESMFATMAALRGVTITYAEGGHEATLTAVPTEAEFSDIDEQGYAVTFRSRAYLLRATDLVLDGSPVEPKRHATITENGHTYRVRAPGGGAHYQPLDTSHTVLRVFTHASD